MIIRVAYIIHTFDIGGLERCVTRLVNHLDKSRFCPVVVCLHRSGDAAQWIQTERIPIIELGKRPGIDLRVIGRLARLLREHVIDIVHSHNWGTLVETAIARRLASVKCHIHAERGMELRDIKVNSWRRKLRGNCMRWSFTQADAVIAVAESVRQRVSQRCGFPIQRVRVIPNGVDSSPKKRNSNVREELRRSINILPNAVVVGSIGRFVPVKDFATAVEAIKQLIQRGHDVHLVLVGDGPLRQSITDQIQGENVGGRIHLVGKQQNIWDWLSVMDVYVNSSLNEGMSQSLLEAMAAGLPSVVTDVGDSAAIVGGEKPFGLKVRPSDATALADVLKQLVEQPQRRKELSKNALIRHHSIYNVETMVRRYEALYNQLYKKNNPVGRHHAPCNM